MFFEHYLILEVNETNVYLIACLQTRKAILVDAGGFSQEVAETIARHDFHVEAILITHDHYDHTSGLASYLDAFPPGCRVLAGASRAGGLKAYRMRDGETIEVGTLTVRALTLPGHTPDSIAFHIERPATPDQISVSVVFSGDALFAGSIGGTGSSRLSEQEVQGIREKLFTLPDDTPVFTGHGPGTTVGVERQHNPFF